MAAHFNVTDDARHVLSLARAAADQGGRDTVTPGDLLRGVALRGRESLGGFLLRECSGPGADLPAADDPGAPDTPEGMMAPGEMSPDAVEVMRGAFRFASELRTPYVSSEHLLVSLLEHRHFDGLDPWFSERGVTETGVLKAWLALMIGAQLGPLARGASS